MGWAGGLDRDFPFSKVEVMKIIIFELFFHKIEVFMKTMWSLLACTENEMDANSVGAAGET